MHVLRDIDCFYTSLISNRHEIQFMINQSVVMACSIIIRFEASLGTLDIYTDKNSSFEYTSPVCPVGSPCSSPTDGCTPCMSVAVFEEWHVNATRIAATITAAPITLPMTAPAIAPGDILSEAAFL